MNSPESSPLYQDFSDSPQASPGWPGISNPQHRAEPALGTRTSLRVVCGPPNGAVFGQAFHDLFDEAVEYHQVPHLPYHSFIKGDRFRIETDSEGCPVLVEVDCPSLQRGHLEDHLVLPAQVERGTLRFLDLRTLCHERAIRIDRRNSLIYIQLSNSPVVSFLTTAPGIIWGIGSRNQLCGLWITGWKCDPSGLARERWRRRSWARIHRRVSARRRPGGIISVSTGQPKDFPISTIFA